MIWYRWYGRFAELCCSGELGPAVRGGDGVDARLALGAAAPVEGLLVPGAVRLHADHVAALVGVGVRVHADPAGEGLGPGAVLRHHDLVAPADRAAGAAVGLHVEGGRAGDRGALHLGAGRDRLLLRLLQERKAVRDSEEKERADKLRHYFVELDFDVLPPLY